MTGQSGRHLEARKAGEELFPQRAPKCRTGIEGAARAAQDVFLVCGARGRPYETFSERLSVPDIHFDVKPEILQRVRLERHAALDALHEIWEHQRYGPLVARGRPRRASRAMIEASCRG